MILIDFSQLAIASAYAAYAAHGRIEDSVLWRYTIQSVIAMRRKHTEKYGHDTVLCCDDGSWRDSVFAYYKWKRRHKDQTHDIDWPHINSMIKEIAASLGKHFGFRVVMVHGAEGDDVIAVLAHHLAESAPDNLFGDGIANSEKPIIVSVDKDFGQLLDVADQYNQRTKKMVTGNPSLLLKEQIIRGDASDGIPNILSADNVFAEGIRQRPITVGRIEKWLPMDVSQIADGNQDILNNWKRNERLISLQGTTPPVIASDIIRQFEEQTAIKSVGLSTFLFDKGLFSLLKNAQNLL